MVIEGVYLRACCLSFVSVGICVSSPFSCVPVLVFHLRGRGGGAFYFIGVVFGDSVTGAQSCLVIVAWHCVGNVAWHCDISLLVAVGYIYLVWCGPVCVTCFHWLRVLFMQVFLVCSVFIV